MGAPKTDPAIAKLVKEHAPHLELLPDGRVKCTLNGHVMPPRPDAISTFVGGPKYKKMKMRQEHLQEFKEFEPDIIQSKYHPNSLWCTLSGRLVEKKMASVKKHVEGKHFGNACDMRDAGIKIKVHEEPDPKAVAAAERAAEKAARLAARAEEAGSDGEEEEEEEEEEGSGDSEDEGMGDRGSEGSSELSIPDFVFDSEDEGQSPEDLVAELDGKKPKGKVGAGADGGKGKMGKKRGRGEEGGEEGGGAGGGKGEKGRKKKGAAGGRRPPMVPMSLQIAESVEAAVDAVITRQVAEGKLATGSGLGGASSTAPKKGGKGKGPRPEKKRKISAPSTDPSAPSTSSAAAAAGSERKGSGQGKGRAPSSAVGAPDSKGKGKAVAEGGGGEEGAGVAAKKKKKKKSRKGRGHGAALGGE